MRQAHSPTFGNKTANIHVKKLAGLTHLAKQQVLDYVSDYQLKSACKDAICLAPSKITQMIFAVLEG